jgi:succinate dehydrogenase flavin-adding protein (antitoxin of CptAB toxin-antitoxin module)
MQELDLLLERYLNLRWPDASSAQRQLFSAFLELSDPQLEQYLLRGDDAAEPAAAAHCFLALADEIRGLAVAARLAAPA